MATFTDNSGRTWTVQVNVETIRGVRAMLGVNLLDTAGGKVLQQLADDPVLLCDVIFAICKAEADAKGVSAEDFGRAMAGDPVEQATEALVEELVNFFPSRKRRLLKRAMEKGNALDEVVLQAAEEKLENGEFEEEFLRELKSGGSSTTSPGSSESTPDR